MTVRSAYGGCAGTCWHGVFMLTAKMLTLQHGGHLAS